MSRCRLELTRSLQSLDHTINDRIEVRAPPSQPRHPVATRSWTSDLPQLPRGFERNRGVFGDQPILARHYVRLYPARFITTK
jgi:hypothetical protein